MAKPKPGPSSGLSQNTTDTLKILKNYYFTQNIGQGTYATVYKAYKKDNLQKGTGDCYAVKCISLSSLSKAAKDNIVTEIEILKKVKCEFIVEMLDFEWDSGHIYLIMEFCSGGDLSRFIKQRKKLPENIVRRFLQQIAIALKALRAHNITHMDLKPQNILLSSLSNPKLKIADFGFAQYLSSNEEASSLRGSPLYMAPEILLKHQYDATVDLWSVGIILFECLFGRAPYSSASFSELAEKIKCDKPIEIPNSELSDECLDLLARLLQRDPANRISFEEFFNHPFVDLEHMPSPESYDKGLSFIRQAVAKDEMGDCDKASELYFKGLLYLVPVVQCETNPKKRDILRLKVTEYMDRAELLRKAGQTTSPIAIANETRDLVARQEDELQFNERKLSEAFAKGNSADQEMLNGNYNNALSLYKQALNILVPAVKEMIPGPKKDALHAEAVNWLRKGEEAKSCLAIQKLKLKEVADATKKGEDLDDINATFGSGCNIQ